jgi:hypothetical protein
VGYVGANPCGCLPKEIELFVHNFYISFLRVNPYKYYGATHLLTQYSHLSSFPSLHKRKWKKE